ncbi:hypothetical protein BV210_16300 [Halorientalis sp. IM1011]|nr:hypothetical protein BV210_16300 [Halorientalis sp. IM1011]
MALHVDTVDDTWFWHPIRRPTFDCNSSGTTVVVRPGGRVEYSSVSTLELCDRSPTQYRTPKPGDFDAE